MSLVREMRRRSGLTQAELAERAGTSRTRLSAYEHDHTDPELGTLTRIAAAAGLEITAAPHGTARVGGQITAIEDALRTGDDAYALRLVAELAALVRTHTVAFDAFDSEPGTTGDRRWDALIGGVVEMLAREGRRGVPSWCSAPSRFSAEPWFVSRRRSLRAAVLVETPAALAARNVFLTRASLGSV